MAPSSGTTSTAPCNGTLVPRPIRQSRSSPSPPIGSKNPYSYRYLGKNRQMYACVLLHPIQNLSRDDRWTMDWKLRRKGLHKTQRRAKGRSHTSHELWFILALHLCRWAFDHRVMATAAIILSSVSKCKSIKIYQRLVIVSHLHQTQTHINILTIHVCIPLKWKMQVLDRKALYHADSCHPLFMRTC